MIIRAFTPADVAELERIHSIHYAHQFHLPDYSKFVCAYLVEDEEGIISVSGIRHIPECVTVTNRDRSPLHRGQALRKILDASEFVTRRVGHDQIYVWSQTEKWTKRLKRAGFREPQGHSLILDL